MYSRQPETILELHVARLQGLLQGDTPEARFQHFTQRLRQHDIALALWQEYPVLARQLALCIAHWATVSLEFLQRLCADWDALRATFNLGDDPGILTELDGGVGDRHRGGRSVLIATFSSGLRVVYKPRSLAVDVHFQELLAWLNARGDHAPFRTLKILDRGDYGWVEFVYDQGCTAVEEIQRFYTRQGGYLALLYALEATDFHFENLIAAGEHPVLLDLEALFHPRLGDSGDGQAMQLASRALNDSVLRVGLLPRRVGSNAESEGIDLSGLGAAAGQMTPYQVPSWEGAGTDEMRLARTRVKMSGGQNRPTLHGSSVDAVDYSEAITAGFTQVYRLLLKHRDELLADTGPVARFARDEVRVILRPTQFYGRLLYESFHPDVLRDALDRDRLFDRLWMAIEHCPYLERILAAEHADLQQGDIPIFTTHPGSRDLWSSRRERIADFFAASGLTLVQRRVQRLSAADLEQQLWIIRASLTTQVRGEHGAKRLTSRLTAPQTVADHARLLAAARAVGDRLETLALRGEHSASWVGVTLTPKGHWSLMPLGVDLYNGLPGVALFLAYLGAITQEARYTTLAQAALATLQSAVESYRSYIPAIGAFDGWGGVIYTLTHLGVLWEQPTLLAAAEELTALIPALVKRDEQYDLIGGAAGCIGSLLSLYRCAPTAHTLATAMQCGDHLLARAQPMERGIGWYKPGMGQRPLAGFSHGAAGMAWALLELAALTGERRFHTAALDAMAYERSLFSPEAGNWPDLREFDMLNGEANGSHARFMTAWCHGASGIGLARLGTLQHLDDAAVRAEINTALVTTLAQGFSRNHSLCHGDLGGLELLLQASLTLDPAQWHAPVGQLATVVLESIDRHGWLCGVPLSVESPGLMTGLAGIGYGLLRLAEPKRVPAVLLLAPPMPHF